MSNARRARFCIYWSSRLTRLFVLHPFTDEIGARDDTEMATLTAHEVLQGGVIQLLQMSQIEQRPQGALDGGGDELVEIS